MPVNSAEVNYSPEARGCFLLLCLSGRSPELEAIVHRRTVLRYDDPHVDALQPVLPGKLVTTSVDRA